MSQNSNNSKHNLLPGVVRDYKGERYWFSGDCFIKKNHSPGNTKDSFIIGSALYSESIPFTQEQVLVEIR